VNDKPSTFKIWEAGDGKKRRAYGTVTVNLAALALDDAVRDLKAPLKVTTAPSLDSQPSLHATRSRDVTKLQQCGPSSPHLPVSWVGGSVSR